MTNSTIRTNGMILGLLWCAVNIVYVGTSLELDIFGGNLFVNLIVMMIIEIFGAIFGGMLIMKYKIEKLLKLSGYITGFISLLYIFYPKNIFDHSLYYQIIWLVPIYLIKYCMEVNWNIATISIPIYLPIETISLFLTIAQLITRIPVALLPFFNSFSFSYLHLSPFVCYGIYYILISFFSNYATKIKEEKKYKDFKLNNEPISPALITSFLKSEMFSDINQESYLSSKRSSFRSKRLINSECQTPLSLLNNEEKK